MRAILTGFGDSELLLTNVDTKEVFVGFTSILTIDEQLEDVEVPTKTKPEKNSEGKKVKRQRVL